VKQADEHRGTGYVAEGGPGTLAQPRPRAFCRAARHRRRPAGGRPEEEGRTHRDHAEEGEERKLSRLHLR
jgi:hypothetical protein